MSKKIKLYLAMAIIVSSLASCANVRPYQKMYLNDRDMVLSQQKTVTFETNFSSYREGAAGANGGKVGGGCGCN